MAPGPGYFPAYRASPRDRAFQLDANIGFPGTDLSVLSRSQNGSMYCKPVSWAFPAASRRYRVLSGSDGAGVRTERRRPERILDLFSHRWTQFAYHAWRKYRTTSAFVTAVLTPFHSACTHCRAG